MSGNTSVRLVLRPIASRGRMRILLAASLLASPLVSIVRAHAADQAVDEAALYRERDVPEAATPASVEAAEPSGFNAESIASQASRLGEQALDWYRTTPPGDRVAWGGLVACSLIGIGILFERSIRLRERKILPSDFTAKFLDRLHGGKLDAGRALDYCEENPSPAARVALAAVRRWGRPPADLERAVALAQRVEVDRLTRHVGSLRRIAALAPLIGFLGTLLATGRILAAIPPGVSLAEGVGMAFHWGPELASALAPLTAGIVVATLAVVAYDGLAARIERLTGSLDRLGAETIDAIAMTVPATPSSLSIPTSRPGDLGIETLPSSMRMHPPLETAPGGIFGLVRPPHQPPAGQTRADRRVHLLPISRNDGNAAARG